MVKKHSFVLLLLALFCLIAGGCAVSVEQAYDELKGCPYPFDAKIEACIFRNFLSWNKEERMQFVIKLFPLTDAGSTYVLMEQSEKYGLLPDLVEYAEKHNDPKLKACCQLWLKQGKSN